MVTIVVYFDSHSLPSRELWEKAALSRRLPLFFSDGFEPGNHPICGPAQVDHPDGLVTVKLGAATCRFQLDLYRITTQTREDFLDRYYPHVFENCDSSAAFRWYEGNGADALGAQLATATFALATKGIVLWQRAKGGFRVGEEAYETISKYAFNEAKGRAGENYKFSKKELLGPRMTAQVFNTERIECPRCGKNFSVKSASHWDGEKHLTCGQLIVPEYGST